MVIPAFIDNNATKLHIIHRIQALEYLIFVNIVTIEIISEKRSKINYIIEYLTLTNQSAIHHMQDGYEVGVYFQRVHVYPKND